LKEVLPEELIVKGEYEDMVELLKHSMEVKRHLQDSEKGPAR